MAWVSVGVPSMTKGEQHDMVVGKGEEGNKMDLHVYVYIGVYRT
jgi:hypothetical protein